MTRLNQALLLNMMLQFYQKMIKICSMSQKEYYKNKHVKLKNNDHNIFYTFKTKKYKNVKILYYKNQLFLRIYY